MCEDTPISNSSEVQLDAKTASLMKTITSQPEGLAQLQRMVDESPDAPWIRRIPLNSAVMTGNLRILRYLVDQIKVDTLNTKTQGYTPLQMSVIWGQLEVMVYLLSRGADLMLTAERSVVNVARLRQQRLREAFEQSEDGAEFENFSITKSKIGPLIEVGLSMLEVLEGIEAIGSYLSWARNNRDHRLVRLFSPELPAYEPRYELLLLRALVQGGRASLLPAAERAALAEQHAAQEAARVKKERPLIDALVEAGFSADVAKSIRDTLRLPTVGAVQKAKLSPEDIEKQLDSQLRSGRMREGERRKFERFVRELDEPVAAQSSLAPSAYGGTASAKSKAVGAPPAAKAMGAPPAAKAKSNAALMALASKGGASKGAGRGASAKAPAAKPKKAVKPVDGIGLFFSETLPNNAFMIVIRFCF